MSGFFSSSLSTAFMRSSNCPRYLVPATMEARSREMTRLSKRVRGTRPSMMRRARPSAMALLPTPGSPMRMGLFFLRRERIWAMRSSSFSRPTMGSSRPSWASRVRSRPKFSKAGVLQSDLGRLSAVGVTGIGRSSSGSAKGSSLPSSLVCLRKSGRGEAKESAVPSGIKPCCCMNWRNFS